MRNLHLYSVDWFQRALDESGISPSSSNEWHDRHIVCLINPWEEVLQGNKKTSNWRSFMWCVADHTFHFKTGLHKVTLDLVVMASSCAGLGNQYPEKRVLRDTILKLEVEMSGLQPLLEKPSFTIEWGIFLLSSALGQIQNVPMSY